MTNKTHTESPIQKAVNFFGTDVQLAEVMNVTPQAVGKWRRLKVPAERCLEIETKTKGAVTRYELRPDVFGKEPYTA